MSRGIESEKTTEIGSKECIQKAYSYLYKKIQ